MAHRLYKNRDRTFQVGYKTQFNRDAFVPLILLVFAAVSIMKSASADVSKKDVFHRNSMDFSTRWVLFDNWLQPDYKNRKIIELMPPSFKRDVLAWGLEEKSSLISKKHFAFFGPAIFRRHFLPSTKNGVLVIPAVT